MQRKMPMMRKEFITGTMDRASAVMICRIYIYIIYIYINAAHICRGRCP